MEKTNKDLEEISRDLDEILSRTERHDENPVYSPDGKELLKFGYFKNKEGK
ncbi:hypothetical protein JIY74_28445 [Vibrio harveyi]|nr:hypothetical protein [Vibrio harveyi]